MNQRTVATYQEAIKAAKSGSPVNVAGLPSLPDMVPLPSQTAPAGAAPRAPPPTGPVPGGKKFLHLRTCKFSKTASRCWSAG